MAAHGQPFTYVQTSETYTPPRNNPLESGSTRGVGVLRCLCKLRGGLQFGMSARIFKFSIWLEGLHIRSAA